MYLAKKMLSTEITIINRFKDSITAFVFGDCLGVPFEFMSPTELRHEDFKTMKGGGLHRRPPGTWSDDTSLMMCAFECLKRGGWPNDIGDFLAKFLLDAHWAVDKHVFDIGITTRRGLESWIEHPESWGTQSNRFPNTINDLGNGALMRMAPGILFAHKAQLDPNAYRLAISSSHPTHNHSISIICCTYYLIVGKSLLAGETIENAIINAMIYCFGLGHPFERNGKDLSQRSIFKGVSNIKNLNPQELEPKGYVVGTLEIALWSILNSSSTFEAIQNAVLLGHDTDTNAAVTGSLAALVFGNNSLPNDMLTSIRDYSKFQDALNKYTEEMASLDDDHFDLVAIARSFFGVI
jgi:ADP-ribosyl-[dinitrogen reductase] hydrolase